jgi:hypothetical protein
LCKRYREDQTISPSDRIDLLLLACWDLLRLLSRVYEISCLPVAHPDEVTFTGGQIKLNSDPTQALYLTDIMRRRQLDRLQEPPPSCPIY